MSNENRWRDFLDAVSEMRHSQREFFRTRSQPALERSRKAVKRVDEMCAALRCGQRNLFEDPGGSRRSG